MASRSTVGIQLMVTARLAVRFPTHPALRSSRQLLPPQQSRSLQKSHCTRCRRRAGGRRSCAAPSPPCQHPLPAVRTRCDGHRRDHPTRLDRAGQFRSEARFVMSPSHRFTLARCHAPRLRHATVSCAPGPLWQHHQARRSRWILSASPPRSALIVRSDRSARAYRSVRCHPTTDQTP